MGLIERYKIKWGALVAVYLAAVTFSVENTRYLYVMHRQKIKWIGVALVCVIGALFAILAMDWSGWAQTWGGDLFKAASGGFMGWSVSRIIIGLNLSELPPEHRPVAALSQAILIAGFAIAVS